MIPAFVVRVMVASLLLACAALAAERVAAWYGRSRRWVWVAAIGASLALPLLAPWTSRVIGRNAFVSRSAQMFVAFEPAAAANATSESPVANVVRPGEPARFDVSRALQLAWIGMSLTMLVLVVVAYSRLRGVRVNAASAEIDGELVLAVERTGPAVIGLWHPAIVVPHWVLRAPADEQRLIVLHEREHINARDPWLLVFGTLVTIAMPWNVVIWWQYRRLRLAMETDCDARVLARVGNRELYGRTLIRAAGDTVALPALAPAWGERASELKERILAMTARPPRARLALASGCIVLAGAATFAACASTARPGENERGTGRRPGTDVPYFTDPQYLHYIAGKQPFALPARGYVRVVGYTREHLRTRIVLTGTGASLESVDGSATLHGDTLEATTPVVFRIVTKGVPDYQLVAHALETGTEVEIQGVAPVGYGYPAAASARGPAPMLNFMHSEIESRGAAAPPALVEPLPAAIEFPETPRPPANFEPGAVRIESENGARVRVRVGSNISFRARGAGMSSDRSDGTLEIITPTTLTITGTGVFAMVLEAVDPNDRIRVTADGRSEDGVVRAGGKAPTPGDAIVVFKAAKGAGICSVARGTRAPDVKC